MLQPILEKEMFSQDCGTRTQDVGALWNGNVGCGGSVVQKCGMWDCCGTEMWDVGLLLGRI